MPRKEYTNDYSKRCGLDEIMDEHGLKEMIVFLR
jgi:hypothetical protein